MNKIISLALVLTVLSCHPRQVRYTPAPGVLKANLREQNIYFKDTSLTKYIGEWESDQILIKFTRVSKKKIGNKNRSRMDMIQGRVTFLQASNSELNSSLKTPVFGMSFERNKLSVSGSKHFLSGRLSIDSVSQEFIIVKNYRQEWIGPIDTKNGKKYIGEREYIEGLKFPKELRLERVKQ